MRTHVALAIMARHPTAGAVKTRLARAIGAERACTLYRAFLRDLDERFTGGHRGLIWAFHPPDSDFAACVSAGARCLPQSGNGLGERMHNCFRRLCADGFEKVILIGTDAPHLRDQWLDEAEAALDTVDVVLGPTDDGGYYLIAMRQPHDLFHDIEMSTERVLADTLVKARAASLTVHLLARTFDIDEGDDLARLRALLEHEHMRSRLPHTTALLKEWNHECACGRRHAKKEHS
jgi:rSAM/selenodomain-associated transferase 1